MNYPNREEPPSDANGWRQSSSYALRMLNEADDSNLTRLRDPRLRNELAIEAGQPPNARPVKETTNGQKYPEADVISLRETNESEQNLHIHHSMVGRVGSPSRQPRTISKLKAIALRSRSDLLKFGKMIGPGFMISVAYIDPGNYATDVAAGASYKYQLLVMVLFSNFIAIFLQSLCIKLGSVTGMNLAENCYAHLPRWLNYFLWFFAESAIIATDIAEVLGTAIALNLLLHIPLVAGCAISILDVLVILLLYRPSGSMKAYRYFEFFIMALVLGVVVCFAIELSLIYVPNLRELFRGYAPSKALVQAKGLYQACGILGATVMPHSLYLGSGLVQPRLREYDIKQGNYSENPTALDDTPKYRPTLSAIKACMSMSIWELGLSLFTFALFVNSAILIVAGASLYGTDGAESADLFGIYKLLQNNLSKGAAVLFALALFLSGTSAGIVCTMAGQMVCEGQLKLQVKPWLMRLMTRSISITPSIIIAGAVGRQGVSAALNGSQVALSVILPFTSAPLIYFTCRNKFMTVHDGATPGGVKMRNNVFIAILGVALWALIAVMNVALLVLAGLGLG